MEIKCIASVAVLALVLPVAATEGWSYRWPVLVPEVQEKSFKRDVQVVLDDRLEVIVSCANGEEMSRWVRDRLRMWFGLNVRVRDVVFSGRGPSRAGGYSLEARSGTLSVEAQSPEGVRYALSTLRQLAQPLRGTLTVKGWEMPEMSVRDWPEVGFRGVHLCYFPEESLVTIEHLIRMAAYYKFNYVVLEPWGTYRSEKYPWYGFRNGKLTPAECRRLSAIATDLGLTLIPQINIFGHATAARSCSGKNATLCHAPEYAPLFEPGTAWNWCLSNPETRKVQEGLVAEMYEAFGRPGYVHLGCDEADEASCSACCASLYRTLVANHIRAICAKVEKLGARPMMWHDMLLASADSRWNGFFCNGAADAERLLDSLPKSLVICDWYYGEPKADGRYPTLDYFGGEKGFTTLTCPWDTVSGIRGQCAYARTHAIGGVLVTSWHHFTGASVRNIYSVTAACSWSAAAANAQRDQAKEWFPPVYSYHWRQTGNDTPGADVYDEQGWFADQVRKDSLRN